MRKNRRLFWAGLVGALALLAWLGLTIIATGSRPAAPISRTLEPVIVSGEQLAEFQGAPLDDLFVYAYDGSTWAAIPFQIDEVDATGTYTVEDRLLDANDELVFMAMDLGSQATPHEWLTDTASQAHPRYELRVTNPLAPAEQGQVYLYHSATLSPTILVDYVDWDAAGSRYVAGAYVLGFAPASHYGMDSLELNGSGMDALDRSKMRINVDCYIFGIPININLTEDDLAGLLDQTPAVDGPVRAGGGTVQGSNWAYYALDRSKLVLDVGAIEPPPQCSSIVIRWIRLSSDWQDPMASGMAPVTYYDANTPEGVAVDGVPDSVPTQPVAGWRQVSGAQGSVVTVVDSALDGGSLSNYYLDDLTENPGDTGDQRSYGDAGALVDNPSGQMVIDMVTYVLDAGQPNVGDIFRAYYEQPLTVAATAQSYDPTCDAPSGVTFDWTPRPAHSGSMTVFTANVAGGDPPFTYTWEFADDGSAAADNPVNHTFTLSGTFMVTVTVGNACGAAAPLTQTVEVLPAGPVWRTYLPLVSKRQ